MVIPFFKSTQPMKSSSPKIKKTYLVKKQIIKDSLITFLKLEKDSEFKIKTIAIRLQLHVGQMISQMVLLKLLLKMGLIIYFALWRNKIFKDLPFRHGVKRTWSTKGS